MLIDIVPITNTLKQLIIVDGFTDFGHYYNSIITCTIMCFNEKQKKETHIHTSSNLRRCNAVK